MTLPEFSEIFAVLAMQLRFTDADEATIRSYFKAMQGADLELVALAAERFANHNNGNDHWFPKTSEWLELTRKIASERRDHVQRVIAAQHHRGLAPLCHVCDDTSWEPVDGGVRPCSCRQLRHLEIIGRRPLPPLLESGADHVPTQVDEAIAVMAKRHEMPKAGVFLQTDPQEAMPEGGR